MARKISDIRRIVKFFSEASPEVVQVALDVIKGVLDSRPEIQTRAKKATRQKRSIKEVESKSEAA